MLLFAEILGKNLLGDFRVLRVHLQDIYDFAFMYRSSLGLDSIPSQKFAATLIQGGYAVMQGSDFVRYGIGEFKASGDHLIEDLDESEPREMPDTPDLLVCWSFDVQRVQQGPWIVEDSTGEFPGQTHTWLPQYGEVRREDLGCDCVVDTHRDIGR
jgi:hypothetical protein